MTARVQMRGSLTPGQPWDVVVDLFFYREPEETKDEAEEGGAAAAAPDAFGGVADAYGGQGLPAPPGRRQAELATAFHPWRMSLAVRACLAHRCAPRACC